MELLVEGIDVLIARDDGTGAFGVAIDEGAEAFVVLFTARTTAMRTTVVPTPRATHVVRRHKRHFFSEVNGAP